MKWLFLLSFSIRIISCISSLFLTLWIYMNTDQVSNLLLRTLSWRDGCQLNKSTWFMDMSLNLHMEDTEEEMYLHAQRCRHDVKLNYITRAFWWVFPEGRILAMFSRKRKHGYEDDDHVVKKPLVTEEVSDSFTSVSPFWTTVHFFHHRESNKALSLCRSGQMKTWIFCSIISTSCICEYTFLKHTDSLRTFVEEGRWSQCFLLWPQTTALCYFVNT